MISRHEVDRNWELQSLRLDQIQYQFANGHIDEDKYYALLKEVNEAAEEYEREYSAQFRTASKPSVER